MLLFGHRFIKSASFYHVSDVESVLKTPPSSTIYLEFKEENLDIIEYLQSNSITFAMDVKNITEAIYASALGASYITVNETIAKEVQQIAQEYLFDAKILVHVEDDAKIEQAAKEGIDGVIYPEAIVKVAG